MDMSFRSIRVTNRRRLPLPSFDLYGTLFFPDDPPLVVLSARCAIRYRTEKRAGNELLVDPDAALVVGDPIVTLEDRSCSAKLTVAFDYRTLKAIEALRNGKGGAFFELDFNVVGAQLVEEGEKKTLGVPCRIKMVVEDDDQPQAGVSLSRDEWLSVLNSMGFSDMEVFELPTYKHPHLSGMQKAIEALRGAEQAFGLGDWHTVMVKTRGAFEAVGSIAAEGGDMKAGFQRLWEGMFPEAKDKDIRAALDGIVDKLAKFQHLGRHLKHPFPEIQRPEALLVLRQTLALFEYVGQRLTKV